MPRRNWNNLVRSVLLITIALTTFLYVRYDAEMKERERALESYLATHYNIPEQTYSLDGTLGFSGYVYDVTFTDEPDADYSFQVTKAVDGHRIEYKQAAGVSPSRVSTFTQ
ncbi:hypothetical protein [Exiguobacterium aurantiacum]|uniref:DUF3139 domain-containing protein n=1 Tax=Exiguobacterium aurantiacum TaxID=33987 RepID=A0A377FR71_9BACL|nr:hypothetical protein [Exiguobacterium aurantiacum]STO06945.1 Uncharacterised protein [Exiguobacterium aurantiacum]